MAFLSKLNAISRFTKYGIFRNMYIDPNKQICNFVRHKSMFPKFKANERNFQIKDKMPENFTLIYRNTMSNYLLGAQIVSVLSCVIVGAFVWYAEGTLNDYQPRMSTWKEQPQAVDNELIVYCSAILTVSVILQYFIKKMPLRIYSFKDEKYVFVYYNVFPFATKKFTCSAKEIRKLTPKPNPILPWTDSRYDVHKNYGAILIDQYFKNPAEMNIMLGIQKRYTEEEFTTD